MMYFWSTLDFMHLKGTCLRVCSVNTGIGKTKAYLKRLIILQIEMGAHIFLTFSNDTNAKNTIVGTNKMFLIPVLELDLLLLFYIRIKKCFVI